MLLSCFHRFRFRPLAMVGFVVLALCANQAISSRADASVVADPASKKTLRVPGDDFFGYVNGDWRDNTAIPADRNSWGVGQALAEDTNQRLVQLIEAVGKDAAANPSAKQVADFYAAFMNEERIEAQGLKPLAALLRDIDAIKNKQALAQALGAGLRADVDPLNAGTFATDNLFGMWVGQDFNAPDQYAAYLLQGGIILPDAVFYTDPSPRMKKLRQQYQQYIVAMFKLAGLPKAEQRAAQVFALELKIAQGHASREDSDDVKKANNPWRPQDFASKAPGLDWDAYLRAAKLDQAKQFIVWHPQAMRSTAKLVASTRLAQWQDYLRFHTLHHYADALPKAFGAQRFAFFGKAMSGTPQQAPRWRRALTAINKAIPEPLGKMYVERYFPPENKARVQQMVSNIISAFGKRIEQLDWMAPATREQAQAKLKTLVVGIGYPDYWPSYASLQVAPDDALGNAWRAERYHTQRQLDKLGKKVDRSEWAMAPQLVNAVNMPIQNAMNFPAAILQPPYFDPKASDALNYGAIGAIIGHEISHSFDDVGAQFDATGRLRDWWSTDDLAHFKIASKVLVGQYSAYRPFPDLALNGQLTLSENLADLAGLAAAYDAFRAIAGDKSGAQADREFFIGYAQSGRNKMREGAMRQQILTDGHAPAEYRAATVRNFDAWYKAFDVQAGQKLYLPPEQRAKVW